MCKPSGELNIEQGKGKRTVNKNNLIFNTNKRIKLGIWGLGRGMSFYSTAKVLNFDVVAGCDYNEHMRRNFLEANPGARATADADEFLSWDFDAVLLATFCPAHAGDAIRCLEAGKHVLSEVTAFHTMAEGVKLVEAVEKSGKVYNLAENYPFMSGNMYLAEKWRQGLFGELMYAEYEYVHEIRSLGYTYIDGIPVQPGWTVHSWRSWLNFHYYNTHSLGPVMHITGLRPTRVVSLPCAVKLAGYLPSKAMEGEGTIAPSLITMSNGAIMRNLMGSTTNDSHFQRLWGTLGASEWTAFESDRLRLRLGCDGDMEKLTVTAARTKLDAMAAKTGHGGGDFWVLYNFAREILYGKPAFFDVYRASDCTIPGILALRSAMDNGKPYDVPDFRKKSERDKYRRDNWEQKRYDVRNGAFPKSADRKVVGEFTTVMNALVGDATLCRAAQDWVSLADDIEDADRAANLLRRFDARRKQIPLTVAKARRIIREAPKSGGARVLREMIEMGGIGKALEPGFVRRARNTAALLERRAKRAKK